MNTIVNKNQPNNQINTTMIDHETNLKEMIKSCYAYGGADRETYNFERYIKPHKKYFTDKKFDEIYTSCLQELILNYSIRHNVYTDIEGCSYNELIKKSVMHW